MSQAEPAPQTGTDVSIRACQSHDDLKLCVELQRRVWNFADEDVVPAAIFVVAQHTGGHAYLAFHQNRAVGFALAFSTEHDGRRFWHSHMVAVLSEFQDQGIGRMLKLHQRSEALRLGIPAIEWTFDPLELRNAHFNIARLGAIVRNYIADCYGASTSPLHGGAPTDRLVAEWLVGSDRVKQILGGASRGAAADAIEIPVPSPIRELRHSGDPRALEIQADLRGRLTQLFSRGYAVTHFRREPERGVYLLEPYED